MSAGLDPKTNKDDYAITSPGITVSARRLRPNTDSTPGRRARSGACPLNVVRGLD